MRFNASNITLILAIVLTFFIYDVQAAPTLRSNGKIAFTSDRDGNSEIYVMNADGSGQTRLTNNSVRDDYPTWSPDGSKIAFIRQNGSVLSINLMNADGTNQTELTTFTIGSTQSYPYERFGMSWSPDGTKIAFQDSTDIFTINIDGSNRINLTNGQFFNYEPSWSPDGLRIAFARSVYSHGFYPQIHTMGKNGQDVTRITYCSFYCENRSPVWSPDGGQIAIDHNDQDDAYITLVNADGTSPQHNPWGAKPKWSPDGTKIAFYESYYPSPPISQIWVMNRNGSGLTQLTNTSPNNVHPDWQPLTPELNFTVTRSDDRNNATCVPGDCSLREAVNAANASATDDSINFAAGLTRITLTNEIVINNAGKLTINGIGTNVLTIDGGAGTNRIFYIDQATASISGMTLTGGNGTGAASIGKGGAINANGGSLTLNGVHVTGNSAGYGGGLAFINGSTSRILNSTLSANTAGGDTGVGGGGVAVSGGTLTIVNSTISGNSSCAHEFCYGGGIYSYSTAITYRNVTITNNFSGYGGGILEEADAGTHNFGNTIVAGNTAAIFGNEIVGNYFTRFTSVGGNLVGDSPGDSVIFPGLTYQPTDIRDTNPLLGALQNNGGTTPTRALLAGSPIIDKGLNSLVSPLAPNFDQRGTGFARIRDGNGDGTATVDIGAFEVQTVNVTNLEELYAAVNNPQNAGMLIIIAPGVYMLSVNDPNGVARPNSGRLELQENMSLHGVAGDRGAVVIDAINLPRSSFDNAPPITLTGAIRMGRGSNSIEWLTVRNAVNGNTNIGTDLPSTGTVHIRVAHVATSNSQRGIDVRNVGEAMAGRVIEAEIVDNDIFNNRIGNQGEALRIVNNAGADGGVVSATLSGNRSYNNFLGLIVENNGASLARVSVTSSGDRFFENGLGALVGAALTQADGNTVNFTATGTSFENNNGFNNFDHGGLVIIGGENLLIPNGTSDNTVNVELRGCRLANNQLYDLGAFAARSNPASIGLPGTNNRVNIRLYSTGVPVLVTDDSIPDSPGGMNSVVVSRPAFDFDHDGLTELSIFRPSNRTWYLQGGLGGFTAMQFGVAGDLIAPADYDGDGKTDVCVFRPSNGTWYTFNSGSQSFTTTGWGANGDLPVPADHDGDGRADLVVFRPSTNTWYTRFANGTFSTTVFGVAGDKPVVGDFDGDGKADIALYRPSDNNWYILKTGFGFFVQTWGQAGDIPVPADYDGDGATDVAVFRPSTGQWFRVRSTAGFDTVNWGANGDKPIPADYDGDGKADVAVFRESNSTWYIVGSTTGIIQNAFGQSGDVPTQGAFIY
jgi:CSLREA domain-containing protein